MTVLSNAFSSEFGWTAGPALNIVTKSGTNSLHGEGLYMDRPGGMQAKSFSTKNFCPPSVSSCVTPTHAHLDQPGGRSGHAEPGLRLDRRGDRQGQDLLLRRRRLHRPGSNGVPFEHAAGLRAAGERQPRLHRPLPPGAGRRAAGPEAHAEPDVDVPREHRPVPRRQSAGRRGRHERAQRGAQVRAAVVDGPGQSHVGAQRRTCSTRRASPIWTATRSRNGRRRPSPPPTRAAGPCRSPSDNRELSNLFGHQAQFSDTLSWSHGRHYVRFGGSVVHHTSGGFGSEPGTAVLGTFTFKNTTTAPFDQLTLADVQNYTQPINFGISTYNLKQWLYRRVRAGQHPCAPRPHGRPRAALRPADPDRRDQGLRAARRLRLASGRRFAPVDSRRLRHVLHADSVQPGRQLPGERAGRIDHLHRDSRATRLPDLPDGIVPAAVVRSEDAAGFAIAGARHHDPGGPAGLLRGAVREVRAELRPAAELSR